MIVLLMMMPQHLQWSKKGWHVGREASIACHTAVEQQFCISTPANKLPSRRRVVVMALMVRMIVVDTDVDKDAVILMMVHVPR